MSATVPLSEPPAAIIPLRAGLRIDVEQPQDEDVERNRLLRWGVLLTTTALTTLGPMGLMYSWFSRVGPNAAKFGLILGLAASAALTIFALWRMIVSNEEWSAYATLNPITGTRVIYGPGWHPALPWEERNAAGEISLRVVSTKFEVGVSTRTSSLVAKGSLDYQVDLEMLQNYIGIDPSTILTGFAEYVRSFLTSQISNGTAVQAQEKVDFINDRLADEFMGTIIPATHGKEHGSTTTNFERKFGIRVVSVFIATLELPPDVQRTRNALDEATRLNLVCAELMGLTKEVYDAKVNAGDLSPDQVADLQRRAMVISGNATAAYDRVDGTARTVTVRPM